jgi:hypothetical protein
MLLLALCLVAVGSNALDIHYPRPEAEGDVRSDYPLHLLQMALAKSGADYQLKPSAMVMDQGRALVQLERGAGDIDVVWSSTSNEREARLLPIRIPIYKGLIGWRLALVKSDQQYMFAAVKSAKELRAYMALQGHDWPDTTILRNNGLPVLTDPSYLTLFKLLASGKQDLYFPRSVVEIWDEAAAHAKDGIVVEPYVVLHYPSASYYFVNRRQVGLAEAIRRGLERCIADGSFERAFNQRYGELIRRAQFDHRTVIELQNPDMPPQSPLNRRELWFDLLKP